MLKKILIPAVSVTGLALSGCATQQATTYQGFSPVAVAQNSSTAAYKQKANTLHVIVDASGSKAAAHKNSENSSFDAEKQFLYRLNKSIPASAKLSSGLRNFGMGPCTDWQTTNLVQAIAPHSQSKFQSSIDKMTCAGGGSPMENALAAAATDLDKAPGKVALLVVADGHGLSSKTLTEAQALEDKFGDRLCIYSVWVGNDKELDGQSLLQQFSNIADCGTSAVVSDLNSAPAVAAFVENMLFTKTALTPAPAPRARLPQDSDGDGVIDARDKCPNTPAGARVDSQGCWSFTGIEFEFDSAVIKPQYTALFDNAIQILKANPGLTVQLDGHTDSRGPANYNLGLSTRRSQAVKDHLLYSGINASRIAIKGFGESEPIADNSTSEGRAENRRVTYTITGR